MERVETLCNKLQEQIAQNASPEQLLMTVQMLQSEILHLQSDNKSISAKSAEINIPFINHGNPSKLEKIPEEKIVEVLQIDEAEVEAELEEIRRNVETRNKISVNNKPPMLFDPVEDTPTLIHQQATAPVQQVKKTELHEVLPADNNGSLNDKLKQPRVELSDTLQDTVIKDLRKGIGVNDRYLFISDLFRGDEVMYERSIKTINGFTIYPEAEYWIKRELKLKIGWDESNPVVKQFDQLIRRRFSAI